MPSFGQVSLLLETSLWSQMARFWTFQDAAVRTATAGVLLLAISSGILGSFIVLRRMSLLGDSLGHAVLPGVCLGFMVSWTKDPRWIILGATCSAFLASWMIGFVGRNSRLKPDVVMGIVLSAFFGVGTVLLTRIQKMPAGDQSGLNQFLFGQASAISERDLWVMGLSTVAIALCVAAFFKELVVTSFDPGFSVAAGLPVRLLHYLLMGLTTLSVVISIQAVGVVLVSAMLITPAAAALLMTDRMRHMILLAVAFGVVGGLSGLNLSFLGRNLPTGPFIVLSLGVLFGVTYFFSPRYGVATRAFRRWQQARQTQRENLLKAIYLMLPNSTGSVAVAEVAAGRQEAAVVTRSRIASLVRRGWALCPGDQVSLTAEGLKRGRELDRNYRLWEQFLTHEVNLPVDHTQRDAENIEHILGPELVRELEARFEQRHG